MTSTGEDVDTTAVGPGRTVRRHHEFQKSSGRSGSAQPLRESPRLSRTGRWAVPSTAAKPVNTCAERRFRQIELVFLTRVIEPGTGGVTTSCAWTRAPEVRRKE